MACRKSRITAIDPLCERILSLLTYFSIAGRYILEQFEEESPEQYRAILAKLLIKAQEEDDENIVSNHYLQIRAIIKLSHNDALPISRARPTRKPSHSRFSSLGAVQ